MSLASPQASAASSSSSPSTSSTPETSSSNGQEEKKYVQKYLTNCKSFYSCIYCRTHLANHDELVSRSFQGNHGRAYLFNSVINISCGPAMQRELNTGAHAVADIYCSNCETTLGWKYEKAYVKTQKYKEGKYIIELAHVVRENRHLELDKRDLFLQSQNQFFYNKQQQPRLHSIGTSKQGGRTDSTGTPASSLFSSSSSSSASSPRSTGSTPASSSPSSSASASSSPPQRTNTTAAASTSIRDILDDDLMFPYYDELCLDDDGRMLGDIGSPSSFVGSFSSACLHNRIRRSLYLDSKPYDWKYSARLSSCPTADENDSAIVKQSQTLTQSVSSAPYEIKSSSSLSSSIVHDGNLLDPKGKQQHQRDANDDNLQRASSIHNERGQQLNCRATSSLSVLSSPEASSSSLAQQLSSISASSYSAQQQQQQQQQLRSMNGDDGEQKQRKQVDESEILQFNFEADNNDCSSIDSDNYSSHQKQEHGIRSSANHEDVVEQISVNNNKQICDHHQQTSTANEDSNNKQEVTVEIESTDNKLTSTGIDNNNDNNNIIDDNNINRQQQQPVNTINFDVESNRELQHLKNKPPKLVELLNRQKQSSTSTSTKTSNSSTSSFSFDDEEFYDCYTS